MSLKRQAIRHSAIYSVSNLLGRLVGFIMLPFYARIFETQGYGIIALVDSSIGLLSIAFSTGVHQALLKTYHEEPEDRKYLVVGTAICTIWGLSLMCIPLPALASPWIGALVLDDARLWPLIVMGLLTFVIDMGGRSASAFLIIRQQSVLYSLVNLIQLVIGITLNIYLVIYLRVGIIGIFISSLITVSIGAIIFHVKAIQSYGLHYDVAIRKKITRFWFPLIPGELSAYVGRQAERYIVKFVVGLNGVGILEMAYKFPPLLNILVTFPFLRAWQTKCMEIGEHPDGPREIATMFTYYIFLICWGAVFLAANISTVLKLMTPPEFWPAARIAQVDIATTIIFSASTYLLFGLLYTKQTKVISSIRAVMAIGRVIFSFAFITFFGLTGAVYSALFMETVFLIWSFKLSQRAYTLPLEYLKIVFIGVSALLFVYVIEFTSIVPISFAGNINRLISYTVQYISSSEGPAYGKLFNVIHHHSMDVSILIVNSFLCSLYFLVILLVKPDLIKGTGKYEMLLSFGNRLIARLK